MSNMGFSFDIGEKTECVLNDLLNEFSTSQIYGIIWRAVKDASAFYVEKKVTKKHAANTVVGRMQRMGERAIADQWNLQGFGKDYELPQTAVSEILYNRILKIGRLGFEKCPSIAVLEAKRNSLLDKVTEEYELRESEEFDEADEDGTETLE